MILLIVYDLAAGRTTWMEPFDNARDALAVRFQLEQANAELGDDGPKLEIIVLSGDTVEAMARTHGKYFGQPVVWPPPAQVVARA